MNNSKPRKRRAVTAEPEKAVEEQEVDLSVPRLQKMIKHLFDNLENGESQGKVSVGDLLKLLQLYKELTAERVKEVEVRWVDKRRTNDESET